MRIFWRTVIITLFVLPILLAVGAWSAVQNTPLVAATGKLDPASVRRARALLREHDPRTSKEGGIREVALRGVDLDLALGYAVSRFVRGGATLALTHGLMQLRVTVPLGSTLFVNVDATLGEGQGLPRIEQMRVGDLTIPAFVAGLALDLVLSRAPKLSDGTSVVALVHAVRFRRDQMQVAYEWRTDLLEQMRAQVLEDADHERIKVYHHALVLVAKDLRRGDSVTSLIQPLFKIANGRSAGGDAIAENRALLVTLSAYVSAKGLNRLLPEAGTWPAATQRHVRLHGRRDLAQHFLISAGLAAVGGGALADAVGLFKEVDDARFGTGFSFTDIAADRGGTRFGELALASESSALRVQRWVTRGLREVDLLPHPRDLPEFLSEAEFKKRFSHVDSPAYRKLMAEIEASIDARGLYRDAASQ